MRRGAWGWPAQGVLSALLVLLAARQAAATEVAVRCTRIAADRKDELVARLRLAIHSADRALAPERVSVECDRQTTRVVWEVPPTELLEVDETIGLVEGVLDSVDRRLASSAPPASQAAVPPPRPSPAEEPDLTRQRRHLLPLAARRKHRAGGLGLGTVVEPSPQWTVGPRLDIGVGIGALVALATEGVRFGTGGSHAAFVFDVAVGAGWGAPFDPGQNFGFALLSGIEYFSANGPESSQTLATGTFTLGVRAAAPVGHLGVIWAGIDGRYRTSPPQLGAPIDASLNSFSAMLCVGAMLLADPK